MLTKKYPSTTRIVGIVLRSYIPNSGGTPKGKTDSQQDAGIFNPGAGDALQIQDEEKQIQDAFCDNKKNRFFGHDIVLSQVWIL